MAKQPLIKPPRGSFRLSYGCVRNARKVIRKKNLQAMQSPPPARAALGRMRQS